MTELPPATESQARAYANGQPSCSEIITSRLRVTQTLTPEALVNGGLRLGISGPRRTAQFGEECPEPFGEARSGGQPVPCQKQIGVGTAERIPCVGEQVKGQPRVEFRVVDLPAHQSAILIVLYEVVVGVGWKSQRAQAQGIQHWHAQQAQFGPGGFEMPYVEVDQVMADEATTVPGKVIKLR